MKIKKLDKAFTPYNNIFNYVDKLDNNINAIVIALDSLVFKDNSPYIERFKKDARSLIDKGYDDLYKPNVIALYTLLEAAIRDLIIALFREYGYLLASTKEIQKIKIPILEFENLTQSEKYDYLYAEYERDIVKGEKYGVSRFKKLLEPLGIIVQVKADDERSILELAQIRNCIIHRNSIVDKKLLSICPWLYKEYNIGQEITINQKCFHQYVQNVLNFSADIETAVREYLVGEPESDY